MRIAIFSDAHGNLELLENIIKVFNPERIFGLGDFEVHDYELNNLGILGVKGNSYFDPDLPIDRIIEINGYKIMLTHGHTHNVRSSLLNLSLIQKENNINLIFYGHTHVARIEETDMGIIANPGSISIPYSPSYPTFILLELNKDNYSLKILDAATYKIYKEIKKNK